MILPLCGWTDVNRSLQGNGGTRRLTPRRYPQAELRRQSKGALNEPMEDSSDHHFTEVHEE